MSTCKHWKEDEAPKIGCLSLGRCKKAVMFWDATEWDDNGDERCLSPEHKNTLLFVQDASDYSATLYTRAEFGCVCYEA